MLTKQQEDTLIESAYKSGLNDSQVADLLKQENNRVAATQQNKPTQDSSYQEKIGYLQGLPEEQRKQQLGSGESIYQRSRNLGKEKSGLQKGLGTAGNIAETGLLTGAGILGSLIGGKKGSAIATGAVKAGTSTVRETYQNITGTQDEPPVISAAIAPFTDAVKTAAIDFVISSILEVPGKIKQSFGKGLAGDIVTEGGAGNVKNAVLRHSFDPKEELINRNILTQNWETPQFGNKQFPYKGRQIISDQINAAENVIQNVIKQSDVAAQPVMTKKAALELVKNNADNIAEITGRSYEDVIRSGKQIADELFKNSDVITADSSLGAKRLLFGESFNKSGAVPSYLEKQIKYRLGMGINSNLKDIVPAVKEGLREEEILINLKPILDQAWVKAYQNSSKSIGLGLSSGELGSVANDIFQTSLAFGSNPFAGGAVAISKTPIFLKRIFGSPVVARKMLQQEGPTKKIIKTGASKFLESLGLSQIGRSK